MLDPKEISLSCLIGFDYYDDFDFWQDKQQTQPFDFTGWTQFTMTIGTLVLAEDNGLAINRASGIISPFIARSVTANQNSGTVHYVLSAIDTNGLLGCLMRGDFRWERP